MPNKEQFLGQFQRQGYTITKKYIQTQARQVQLYFTRYTPQNPKITVIIVHGLGQPSIAYKEVAQFYVKNQCQVLITDLRGTGYSGGIRHNNQIRQYQNDILCMVKEARNNIPLFIYGHSLGGLATAQFMLHFKQKINISGCIFSSPALGISREMQFNWMKKQIIKFLGALLADFSLNIGLSMTAITANKEKIYDIFESSQWDGKITMRMSKNILEILDQVQNRQKQLDFPAIMFYGDSDTLTDWEVSRDVFLALKKPYKKFHLFEGGYHELKYGKEKDKMLQMSLNFMKQMKDSKPLSNVNAQPLPKIQKKPNPLSIVIFLGIFLIIIARLIGFI